MMKFSVYIVKCVPSGKLYVGATTQAVAKRWGQHKRQARAGAQSVLHRAIRKHGADSFELVDVINLPDKDSMFIEERRQIALRSTTSPTGYNLTHGGEGVPGTDEVRRKQSEKAKLNHQNYEVKSNHIAGVKKAWTGPDGQARREAMSARKTGKPMHPNAKKAIMEAKKTEWYKEVAAKAAAKVWATPGYKDGWVKSKLKKHIASAKRFPMRGDGLIFSSTRSAANYMREEGHSSAAANNICLACNGKYSTSYGHKWKWIDGEEARVSGAEIL
jgi:group I intron endonuclease